jgi:gliding motility-associated-like protein
MIGKLWYIVFMCFCTIKLLAQPANDNCANPSLIQVSENGYGLGTFTGPTVDVTSATLQGGETFAPSILISGLNRKSVWYKFSIATTRSVRVELKQPGSIIQAGNIGFAVYKTTTCMPGNAQLSTKLSPIETFGNTYHPCVDIGEYYIQVTSNLNANGPIFITVEVDKPLPALHNDAANPHEFGVLRTQKVIREQFEVECQGIDAADEICLPNTSFKDFTKSTWHTFTTPAYFDYLGFTLSEAIAPSNAPEYTVGFRLFEGDSKETNWRTLPQIGGCDSFRTNGFYPDRKMFKCGILKPNTTYTVQLVYHKDFVKIMRFAVLWDGARPTAGPLPITTLDPKNKMGVLPSSKAGVNSYAYDTLSCNSIHIAGCGPAMPVEGFRPNAYRYNMSTFFTFTLSSASTIQLWSISANCVNVNPFVRVFKQSPGATCNTLDENNLVGSFIYSGTISCLEPGEYIAQVMGSDSLRPKNAFNYNSFNTTTASPCMYQHLGLPVRLQINVRTEVPTNRFSMVAPGRVDTFNVVGGVRQPLVPNTIYQSKPDTFGCSNTVLPNDPNLCNEKEKAIYRTFEVADSGIIYSTAVSAYNFKIYKGDINALAIAQNKFTYPETIDGLTPYSKCAYYVNSIELRNVCVVPGTYTLANFGNNSMIGDVRNHRITFRRITSRFSNPANPEDLGNLLDTIAKYGGGRVLSAIDSFSCYDNPVTIDGLTPCVVSNRLSSKLLYRQFYLSDPSRIQITNNSTQGTLRLFMGKVSEVGTDGLKAMPAPWNCFTSASTTSNQCNVLEAGWYTVVSYGIGPSYENPLGPGTGNDHYSQAGLDNRVNIIVTPACARPKFNRPFKASVTAASLPHNVDWVEQPTSSPAYPVTATTHNLPTESFDCTNDTPFVAHPILNCAPAATGLNQLTKVAYYVWEITKESYIQITLPSGMWGVVYELDVRTNDSLQMPTATPIQPCMDKVGFIQLCKMQPGVYTLAVFGRANMICNSFSPQFYVDRVGYSRFDHANNAFDFGSLIPDQTFRYGKVGATNPLHPNRQPSNDFFYCTTGAQERDPSNPACMSIYTPTIYNAGNNISLYPDASVNHNTLHIPRRNLWYTFVVNDPGTVFIKVENKTPGKMHQYPFAIYRSDVDATLDFEQVHAQGEVDSTTAQGLTYIANNFTGFYCFASQQISIYNDPCDFRPIRYYVLVENRNPYWAANIFAMNPNSQVEVSLRLDSIQVIKPKFDFYSNASVIATTSPGKFTGETDNFTCATRNIPDPVNGTLNACQKTLWYKFTTDVTGTIRYRVAYNTTNYATLNQIQLLREVIPGDSTSRGLQYLASAGTQSVGGFTWMRRCISPGTYYLLLPGCNAVNEFVFPEIEILEQEGDFCNKPMVTALNGAGNRILPVVIDCHTIGTDYGEFNPTLTCPSGEETTKYKSTWYRLDVGGNDTLDITVFIDEKTNASPTQIKYRMMTGTCAAMQEQSCVQDALTRNTYKCLAPGNSYYIQVFTPVQLPTSPFTVITGSIDLNIEAVVHQDVCNPATNCIAVANFTPQFDCTKDKNVTFVNYSTYGTSISYKWDFGFNNQTSTAVSPQFFYPALTVDRSYTVQLIVINNDCGKEDTIEHTVMIPARPAVDLGPDIVHCISGSSTTFDATSHPGSTYRWSTNSTLPTATFNNTSTRWVQVTYNNCIARDTVSIWVNPIVKRALQTRALCNTDEINLTANRGQGEQYIWSTGASLNNITVSQPGYYWVDLYLNDCVVRDSFFVVSTAIEPLGSDTSICQKDMPFLANALVAGATTYRWQNNSTASTFNITQPGIYWVDITVSGCTFRDSLVLSVDSLKTDSIAVKLCPGTTYQLPGGMIVNTAGIYRDTLYHASGCDSLIAITNLSVDAIQVTRDTATICFGQSYTLPDGRVVTNAGIYRDTLDADHGCGRTAIELLLIVKNLDRRELAANICQGESYRLPSGRLVFDEGIFSDTLRYLTGCDSIIYTVNITSGALLENNVSVTLCFGQQYTLSNGQVVNTAGIYRDTLRYASGCDSIINVIDLEVASVDNRVITASICEGNNYTLPSGRVVSASGTYLDTLRYISGCDSVRVSVQLQVTSVIQNTASLALCFGQTFTLPSGRVVSNAGLYRDTIRTVSGCDSLITNITLSVGSHIQESLSENICSGQSYTLPSGRVVVAAGRYRDTIRTVSGCDSLITVVTLGVLPVNTSSLIANICSGNAYTLPSGRVVSASGTYLDTLRYVSGCDSVRCSVQLQVTSVIQNTASIALCFGQTFTLPSGRVVSNAGLYRDTIRTVLGCDSLITNVTLNVLTPLSRSISAGLCAGQLYPLPSGRQVSQAGLFLDTVRTASGCDSIHFSVNLTVQPAFTSSISAAVCNGASYTLPGGRVVNSAGVYLDTLKTIGGGCDSIITVNLSNSPPLTVSLSGVDSICVGERATFTATASGGNGGPYAYSWIGVSGSSSTASGIITRTTQVIVSVSDGCTILPALDTITITAVQLPSVNAGADTSVIAGIGFTMRPAYSSTVVNYLWTPATFLSCTNCPNPVATVREPITYKVQVSNAFGCEASDSRVINLVCNTESVFLPNTFTPNGDGVNDLWYPRGSGIRNVRFLKVFNRWGQMIFERTNFSTDDRNAGWDGTFKGVALAPDVFVYTMGLECTNGERFETKGNVMIVR